MDMPELPEVIHFKHYIESTALNQTIADIEVLNDQILANDSEQQFKKHLSGHAFASCSNYGKYLFLHSTGAHYLVMHFGMTGSPVYFKNEGHKPDYPRAVFHFDNGYKLAFNCMRMFGRLELTEAKEAFIEDKELGPDISSEGFSFETFRKLMENRRGMIKSSLMDQHLMAGIGNEQSDEILFQSRIHPKRKVSDLSEDDLQKIYRTMRSVIETRVECLDQGRPMPDNFLLEHREENEACPACGGTIEKIAAAGRSGYFCPSCQD
ncbi:Fpg/Nei family DNA glycosylase [Rhodohalobacter mucosus]|uniref:Formamidopyrimidine-DNA glycosylase n=1 Tax=Rhodohalobacter mucosus TaxID=2079485 RepID=A0A316TU04_9BACT|nr:DNA-formamidopyrimidine glycosylase family protein [Rhodohalobacter mucosus]PWN06485.1 formamidopyrimidine-DNA glycosylase [Rhodohalobacter mucosus]